jgi:hypothetical protein
VKVGGVNQAGADKPTSRFRMSLSQMATQYQHNQDFRKVAQNLLPNRGVCRGRKPESFLISVFSNNWSIQVQPEHRKER